MEVGVKAKVAVGTEVIVVDWVVAQVLNNPEGPV
jgi:hypothetical protein